MEYEISWYKTEKPKDGKPTKETTGNLYFNLTGLDTFSFYTVNVSSVNNVTKAIDLNNGSTISFKTFSGRKYILFGVDMPVLTCLYLANIRVL